MKQEGLTTLKLLRQSDSMGVDMPAFRGYLSGLDYADDGKPISYSIELKPEWMSPDYLFNLFPELLSGNRSFKDEEIEVFSPIPDRPRRVETAEELESKILSFSRH